MKLVIIESPFAAATMKQAELHIAYARAALRDSLMRGEAPFASHMLYTQPGVLDDKDPVDRRLGIVAGFEWGKKANMVAVYEDLGISPGMRLGIAIAEKRGATVFHRFLDPERLAEVMAAVVEGVDSLVGMHEERISVAKLTSARSEIEREREQTRYREAIAKAVDAERERDEARATVAELVDASEQLLEHYSDGLPVHLVDEFRAALAKAKETKP